MDQLIKNYEVSSKETAQKLDDFFEVSDKFGNGFGKDERILEWHMQAGRNNT